MQRTVIQSCGSWRNQSLRIIGTNMSSTYFREGKNFVNKKNQAEGNIIMQCEVILQENVENLRWCSERQKWWGTLKQSFYRSKYKIQLLSTLNNKQIKHVIRLCEQRARQSQLHHEWLCFLKKQETCADCVKCQTNQEFLQVRESPKYSLHCISVQ